MDRIEGRDVVSYLTGENTVRDGTLASLHVDNADTDKAIIRLSFHVLVNGGLNVVELELHDVKAFDYFYSAGPECPNVISHLKCLWTEEGHFFLSLDPYDERENFISEQDNDCFRCGLVRLTTRSAGEATPSHPLGRF